MPRDALSSTVTSSSNGVEAGSDMPRSNTLSSRSFSRFEPSPPNSPARSRSSTLQTDTPHNVLNTSVTYPTSEQTRAGPEDIFETRETDEEENDGKAGPEDGAATTLPEGFDQLPIELISLTDRFIESLSAKTHPAPLSIDRLAELFQQFYTRAGSTISTHISTLSSRRNRELRQASSRLTQDSGGTAKDKIRAPQRANSDQQLLTPTEVADRRRWRRTLERTRIILDEAVEKRVCEAVYEKIWRHRSTDDEERDQKLRSRIAALAVVGIGLKELGIDLDLKSLDVSSEKGEKLIQDWLSEAKESLINMNDAKFPLGKLQHLTAAHKVIVNTLSRVHPSSSSADEILPTLIFTLISTPPEDLNVISNLSFIQRFRATDKIDGEAAYCLTNLEAATSFLETVDLASLRAEEGADRSHASVEKVSASGTVKLEEHLSPSSAKLASAVPTTDTVITAETHSVHSPTGLQPPERSTQSPLPTSPRQQRRLSNLLQPSTAALGAASDAVRSTADQSIKNISSTLENSYNLLFGRLREQESRVSGLKGSKEMVVPKTLDDARLLVSTPPLLDDDRSIDTHHSGEGESRAVSHAPGGPDDKMISLISGRMALRDRSTDSSRSAGSGRRVHLLEDRSHQLPSSPAADTSPGPANAALESMRNLGNSLNPLNRFSGISMMRGFGRSASATPAALSSQGEKLKELGAENPSIMTPSTLESGGDTIPFPELDTAGKIAPPNPRFLELENPGDLRLSEVLELLRDYRRLAGALKDIGAFAET